MGKWHQYQGVASFVYRCDWCGEKMATDKAYRKTDVSGDLVRICSHCDRPSIFVDGKQVPGAKYGDDVKDVPVQVGHLYQESRYSLSAGAPTASVMASRKILLNLAVHHADLPAENDKGYGPNFKQCIEHLIETKLPKSMEPWLNAVKDIGNETNHQIAQATEDQAKLLIDFVGQILKVMFEMPAKVPAPPQ